MAALTLGGVVTALGGAGVKFVSLRRQRRADELAKRSALHEDRRAERETFDVRAKALAAALQAHEKNVSAQQQRAAVFEEKAQQLQEHLDAVLDAHSTLHDEYEDLQNKLSDKKRTDIKLMDMLLMLLLSSAVMNSLGTELDEKFEKRWSLLEERLRAEIIEFFGVERRRIGYSPRMMSRGRRTTCKREWRCCSCERQY